MKMIEVHNIFKRRMSIPVHKIVGVLCQINENEEANPEANINRTYISMGPDSEDTSENGFYVTETYEEVLALIAAKNHEESKIANVIEKIIGVIEKMRKSG